MHHRHCLRIHILLSFALLLLFLLSFDVSAKGSQPSFSLKSKKLCIGETMPANIKNLPLGAKVSYRSNKKSIASISPQGQITGLRSGKATITATVKSKKYSKKLSVGPGKDINYDAYLKGKDVNLVIVYAPLYGVSQGWMGLGGTYYTYHNRNIFHCIIDRVPTGNPSVDVYGETYDARTAAMVHETLHCVERNSRAKGWSGFAPLHDAEKYQYDVYNDLQRLDWYSDLMRNSIKYGGGPVLGFLPESFLVLHTSN